MHNDARVTAGSHTLKFHAPPSYSYQTTAIPKRHKSETMFSISSSAITTFFAKTLLNHNSRSLHRTMTSMSHAFAGNPIRSKTPKPSDPVSPQSAIQTLKTLLISGQTGPVSPDFRILPFRKGRPLAGWTTEGLKWHLGWLSLGECKAYLESSEAGRLGDDAFVYLGCRNVDEDDVVYWAVDVSEVGELVNELGARHFCFVELRTLMVATDWADPTAMGDLSIAGHVSFFFPLSFFNVCFDLL